MMNRPNSRLILGVFISVGLIIPSVSALFAYEIDKVPLMDSRKDFVVGPGKVDVTIAPGEERTATLLITNRMGDERVFNLTVEDFTGTNDLGSPVLLLGDERGPYSLRDYLHFEETSFVLKNGERARVPVTISIPFDEEPGGRYGSVLVSTVSKTVDRSLEVGAAGGTAVVSRIGTLFFVRVPGDVEEDGELEKFQIAEKKKFFSKGPLIFQFLYRNKGSVHLNPYGEIRITNMLGDEVGFVEIEPWFAMPDSLRLREVTWDREFMLGRYKATANINRGYDDIIDTMTVTFWVFPWKIVGGVFFGIILLLLILRWIGSKFEIKRK